MLELLIGKETVKFLAIFDHPIRSAWANRKSKFEIQKSPSLA
jgi:hypothetical protein